MSLPPLPPRYTWRERLWRVLDRLAAAVIITGALALVAAMVALPVWFQAHQEAAAFNRITSGPKVTAWDALWLDLRVEAER
jgi:hypothetical protein